MGADATNAGLGQIGVLLRGEPEAINRWIHKWNASRALIYLAVIVVGSGCYGAAMGYWRDPLQAWYVALKFPLIILLTTLGNGLLNGMLAPLLGLNIAFRQSLQAVVMSFAIFGAILGSFSPLIVFMVWNAPLMTAKATGAYNAIILTHVGVIAFAGIAANLRLGQLLRRLGGSAAVGWRVLLAWLTVNLFLGSQLSWILRPFIGAPGLPVQFVRDHPFESNFFETVLRAIIQLFFR